MFYFMVFFMNIYCISYIYSDFFAWPLLFNSMDYLTMVFFIWCLSVFFSSYSNKYPNNKKNNNMKKKLMYMSKGLFMVAGMGFMIILANPLLYDMSIDGRG